MPLDRNPLNKSVKSCRKKGRPDDLFVDGNTLVSVINKAEQFTIILTPVPGWPTSGIQRLRKALKTLLRAYGLRTVSVK